jgi:hypothetical protein
MLRQRPRWQPTRLLEPRGQGACDTKSPWGDCAAQVHLEKRLEDGRPRPHTLTEAQLHELSFETREFSGAMLASLVNAGALAAGRAGREAVGYHDIANARPAAPLARPPRRLLGRPACSTGPRKQTCQGQRVPRASTYPCQCQSSAWRQQKERLRPVGFSGCSIQGRWRALPSSPYWRHVGPARRADRQRCISSDRSHPTADRRRARAQALEEERLGPRREPYSDERNLRLAVQEGATALVCSLLPAIEPVVLVRPPAARPARRRAPGAPPRARAGCLPPHVPPRSAAVAPHVAPADCAECAGARGAIGVSHTLTIP